MDRSGSPALADVGGDLQARNDAARVLVAAQPDCGGAWNWLLRRPVPLKRGCQRSNSAHALSPQRAERGGSRGCPSLPASSQLPRRSCRPQGNGRGYPLARGARPALRSPRSRASPVTQPWIEHNQRREHSGHPRHPDVEGRMFGPRYPSPDEQRDQDRPPKSVQSRHCHAVALGLERRQRGAKRSRPMAASICSSVKWPEAALAFRVFAP